MFKILSNGVVYYEKGDFAAWPANGGLWIWGNEILVSYQKGVFDPNANFHRVDRNRPMYAAFSRSRDGGITWNTEALLGEIYSRPVKPVPDGGFDFSIPGFVLRVGEPKISIESCLYVVSTDRGVTWDGPYSLPGFGFPLTPRTSYFIEGSKTMRMFVSYKLPNPNGATYTDRAAVILTEDGGQSFSLLGEMTNDLPRSVMPSVVRLGDGTLVAALRRRLQRDKIPDLEDRAELAGRLSPWPDDNWIEVRRSNDNGATWKYPVRAAETALSHGNNGNPPALGLLRDGRLVLVYGFRGKPALLKARVSEDGGLSWGEELIIKDGILNHDMGYPRLAVRLDGACVAIYYCATHELLEQHIEATVFTV